MAINLCGLERWRSEESRCWQKAQTESVSVRDAMGMNKSLGMGLRASRCIIVELVLRQNQWTICIRKPMRSFIA